MTCLAWIQVGSGARAYAPWVGYFPAVPRGLTGRKFEDNYMVRWSFVTGRKREHRQP